MMEFHAVIMAAGKGSRMMELTSCFPKCLLPIGNIPVIFCSLRMLKDAGIRDVIILVLEADKSKIQEAVDGKFDLNLDIVPLPKNEDWGTADSLRYIKDRIKRDVIVLSCDLITDFDLLKMASMHRIHDSSLTMCLTPWLKGIKDSAVPGHKGKNKIEKDIIGIDDANRLMFVNSEADFEEGIPLKLSVLMHHPRIHIHSDLMDTHIYMMKKFVFDFIVSNKHISTLKGEFLPVIIARQFSSKESVFVKDTETLMNETRKAKNPDSIDFKRKVNLNKLALELSSWNNHCGTFSDSYCGDDLKCYAYVDKEALCVRANSLVSFLEANKKIPKFYTSVIGIEQKPSSYPKSQVDNDSIVGSDCELVGKLQIKQSVVGNTCQLKEKAKITGSVLMDNVAIEQNTCIQGSIIYNNAQIGSNCEIKNCIIGPEQIVKDSSKLSNEILQRTFEIMEI